jgi:hypothetical protein
MVLEGLGRVLDPELDLLEKARPILLSSWYQCRTFRVNYLNCYYGSQWTQIGPRIRHIGRNPSVLIFVLKRILWTTLYTSIIIMSTIHSVWWTY